MKLPMFFKTTIQKGLHMRYFTILQGFFKLFGRYGIDILEKNMHAYVCMQILYVRTYIHKYMCVAHTHTYVCIQIYVTVDFHLHAQVCIDIRHVYVHIHITHLHIHIGLYTQTHTQTSDIGCQSCNVNKCVSNCQLFVLIGGETFP